MKKPKVYILSAVHNDLEDTKRLLTSIYKQTYENFEVCLVDDGSTDETDIYLNKYYPSVKVIKGNGKLWWTGCMYKALEYVSNNAKKEDFFLTINNDCTFLPDYLSNIVKEGILHENSVIGSVSISKNDGNRIVDSGALFNWKRGRVSKAGFNFIKDIPRNYKYDDGVDALSTRGTLFPVQIIKKIGNFDKKHFPHYISDFEYTSRAKKHGYKLIVSYSCLIYNDDRRTGFSGPSNKQISFSQLGKIMFDRKSRINIVDHFNFVYICCPWYLQPLNYFYLIAKFCYLVSFLPLFFPFRRPLVYLRKRLLFGVK